MRNSYDLNQTTRGHMSDADRLHDCMCDAKERSLLYAKSALESTNNGVREFFLAMHGEETHNQEILFSFLHTRGHYPTEMVDAECIRKVRSRYQQVHDQMGLTDNPSFRRYQTADPQLPTAHIQSQRQNPDETFEYKGDRH